VSIVVPTYREAENLPHLLARLSEAMDPFCGDYEILVVDDDSRDGTEQAVTAMAAEGVPVRLITRVDERGLSSAVLRGFAEARGDVLVCMDADLSHPPEVAPQLVQALRDGADFVIGSRYAPGGGTEAGWGLLRWVNSKGATLLARPFTKAKDPMSGFFCLSRERFESADALNPIGYKIGLELIVKCGCKDVREVPIFFADRKHGQSKLTLGEQLRYIRHLRRLADYRFGAMSKFFQFCLVGVSGTAVDLGVYLPLLVAFPETVFWTGVARAGGISVGMTWNFFVHYMITYKDRRAGSVARQYLKFAASCSVGAVVNWAVSIGLVKYVPFFSRHRFLAAFGGIAAGLAFNFLLTHCWVFRGRGACDTAPRSPADTPRRGGH